MECKINRRDLPNILGKSIVSLTDEDVYTLSAILAPNKGLVSDQSQYCPKCFLGKLQEHFKTGNLNNLPKEFLDDEAFKAVVAKNFMIWKANTAVRSVINH